MNGEIIEQMVLIVVNRLKISERREIVLVEDDFEHKIKIRELG